MKLGIRLAALGLLGLLVVPGAVQAATGAGAIVLAFPVGARYNALGESGTALAEDASATWFNAAGLAFMPDRGVRNEVQLMNAEIAPGLATDMGLYALTSAFEAGGGVLAGSFVYLDMGEQQATDAAGNLLDWFGSYEFVLQLHYGFKLTPTLGLGFGTKYFRDRLAPDSPTFPNGSGWAYAFDVGMYKKFPELWLGLPGSANVGLALNNLSPKEITHVDEDQGSDHMPRRATLGATWYPLDSEFFSMLFTGDYMVPLQEYKDNDYGWGWDDTQAEWGGGVEFGYDHSMFLRFGYKSAEYGDIGDLTYGFGIDLTKWMSTDIFFDFGSVPQARSLDSAKRFSLGYRF